MSQNHLNNGSSTHRDYGATSSSTGSMIGGGASSINTNSSIPDVNFSRFSPTELMSLSEDIGQNIQAIISSCKQLDKILGILGTSRDQQSTRDKVMITYEKANDRIETTTRDLTRLTEIIRRGDKQQKLHLEKLTNDFKTVVERYTSVQTRIATAMRQTLAQMRVAQMQQEQSDATAGNDTDRELLLQRQAQLEQQQLQIEHDMLVERERQIQLVEAKVLDSNAMTLKLNELVRAQHEQVDSIESYVENSATEIEMGREQLSTAAGRRQSYRRKILILLVIAVIIGLIVTGIIVSKVTS